MDLYQVVVVVRLKIIQLTGKRNRKVVLIEFLPNFKPEKTKEKSSYALL